MNDDQVQNLIWQEIKRRKLLFHDMIGVQDSGFQSILGSERMKELLCAGKYSDSDDFPPLKIPLQDLFRFWWNHCVSKEVVVDEVLEDVYDHFIELMRPPRKRDPQMNLALDFHQLTLIPDQKKKAA